MRNTHDFKTAVAFIRHKHKGQIRSGKSPAWHHLVRVSSALDFILTKHKEGSVKERRTITLAALGHDILEDTDANEKELVAVFGTRGLTLIKGMTNRWGDKHAAPYVAQVVRSEEAVRLIKLADLYDNIAHVTFNMGLLGTRWATSYFLPIVRPMQRALIRTRFSRYRKSAAELIALVEAASRLLDRELESFQRHE